MDHEDIAKKAAETIMQRANDTYPHTLHKDMLVDEIGKAIREATQPMMMHPLLLAAQPPINPYVFHNAVGAVAQDVDPRDRARAKVNPHMQTYYGKPE